MITIYHNPRCKISRQVLEMLVKSGKSFQMTEYLKTSMTTDELKRLLIKLNLKPIDIIRKNEAIFKERFKKCRFTDSEWLKIIQEYPILIERPIVEARHKAIICRPPERFKEII
jgi:arsenate reductase